MALIMLAHTKSAMLAITLLLEIMLELLEDHHFLLGFLKIVFVEIPVLQMQVEHLQGAALAHLVFIFLLLEILQTALQRVDLALQAGLF